MKKFDLKKKILISKNQLNDFFSNILFSINLIFFSFFFFSFMDFFFVIFKKIYKSNKIPNPIDF